MMEWHSAHEVDGLVFPKHQEPLFDSLPPTTDSSWSHWGINNINTTLDESFFHNKSSEYGRPDFRFNQMTGADDHMDDIFMNSLFKEDHHEKQQPPWSGYYNDNQHHILPFCFSPESQSSFMPEDGNATSMMLDFLCASSDANGPESSGYFETGGLTFAPSAGWVNNNGQTKMETKVLPISNQNSGLSTIRKETSMEESVLNQLGTVMTQLNGKTQLCFRDSLYRLARSTKGLEPPRSQNAGFWMNNPPLLASVNQMARYVCG
nr:salt stress-like protein [Tamarix hispida]